MSSNSMGDQRYGTCAGFEAPTVFDIHPVLFFTFETGRQRCSEKILMGASVAIRGAFDMFCATGLALVVRKDARVLSEENSGVNCVDVRFDSRVHIIAGFLGATNTADVSSSRSSGVVTTPIALGAVHIDVPDDIGTKAFSSVAHNPLE